jgi:hypothetical protein
LLLRESGVNEQGTPELRAVLGDASDDAGVPHGQVLVRFAEAALGDDAVLLAAARAALLTALGPEALADAAAVVGLFNAIDRVADATGIPLEPEKAAASADLRAALAIDHFAVEARG